ncbi:MAG: hypothetical protein F6K24_58280, partial [Okeania sp. SIO2D1]|nr:hypothetical protein [Okeania sp. SIO2D1]
EGEKVEFYIEGSGGYAISNIDLLSHEIYFTKQELIASLEPIIYFGSQREYPQASEIFRDVLVDALNSLNERSRFTLSLEETPLSQEGPLRISNNQLRKIRKSLLYIADGTAIVQGGEDHSYLIASPKVCIELGYAISTKKSEQILLTQMERPDLSGEFTFDLPKHQHLKYKSGKDLAKTLPKTLKALLKKFNLFS